MSVLSNTCKFRGVVSVRERHDAEVLGSRYSISETPCDRTSSLREILEARTRAIRKRGGKCGICLGYAHGMQNKGISGSGCCRLPLGIK